MSELYLIYICMSKLNLVKLWSTVQNKCFADKQIDFEATVEAKQCIAMNNAL